MRLLLLSLLAFGLAQSHSIGYRTNLLAYAPARGEFPVQNGLAQGYVRYLDGTGAERLISYNYPEPLYGIRRLSYGNEDIVNPLLRSSSIYEKDQTALFRAWCEQRYNALKFELERLRSEGKQPSANMLSQFEPLEQIVKASAYEAVPGLSPEVQKARDEHLRIWNEARLQVLRAEEAQMRLTLSQQQSELLPELKPQLKLQQPLVLVRTTPLSYAELEIKGAPQLPKKIPTLQPIQLNQQYQLGQGPQPVQDTPEVMRAREEHLKLVNEVKLRQPLPLPELPILKAVPGIQQPLQTIPLPQPIAPIVQPIFKSPLSPPQPVEETPEVKRAREEHLKHFQEAKLRLPIAEETLPFTEPIAIKSRLELPQAPIQIEDTPEVKRAREEHLLLLAQAKLRAADKLADIDDMIKIKEREGEAEQLRELELRRQEEKEQELERLREAERLQQETRLLEEERLTLLRAEQQQLEKERYEELQRLSTEQGQIGGYYEQEKIIAQPMPISQPQQQAQQQLQQNGFFLRIQGQPAHPGQLQTQLPVNAAAYLIAEQNPFLLRYIQQQSQLSPLPELKLKPAALPLISAQPLPLPLPLKTLPSPIEDDPHGLSDLDKATREHFRAHEIALEQLRLANLKNPWNPDCN